MRTANGSRGEQGGRVCSFDGRILPLKETRLAANARGGLARILMEQRFANHNCESLAVTYFLPLPADGVVSGFEFHIGNQCIVGEVDLREIAHERYEQALIEGFSSCLLEQNSTSLFSQELGNIPPLTEVLVKLVIDQRLTWLAEGAWEWRFPTAVIPRYVGNQDVDSSVASPNVELVEDDTGARLFFFIQIHDALLFGSRPSSPSHSIHSVADIGLCTASQDNENGVSPDRDVVIRWPIAFSTAGISIDVGRASAGKPNSDCAFALLTLIPPQKSLSISVSPQPRDLMVLLDTSGSMAGAPLDHLKEISSALVNSLTENDRLELIEFSMETRRFKRDIICAQQMVRQEALNWISRLEAGGGTEMRQGIISALRPLRKDAQRQVVLITDGLIGFESDVIQIILEELPPNSRLHTIGIGSSVNRSLTSPAARAGKGVELVVGIDESPQDAIRRLLARTTAPLITDLSIQGSALLQFTPEKIPDLFAESPVLVLLKIKPQGGKIDITGKTRKEVWYDSIEIPPIEPGTGNQAHIALFGREHIEDLEMRLAAGEENRSQIEQQIQQIGLIFQIPSRFTSWIAVSDSISIDPLLPRKRISQPHKLSYGVSAQSMGLRKFASVSPSIDEYLNSSTKIHKPAASTIKSQSSSLIFSPIPDSFHTSRVAESPASDSCTDLLSRIFKGRIIFTSSRKLILEAAIDDKEFCWATPTEIRLICWDGTNVVADIDLESSTPAKTLDKGQLLKIVLHLRPRFSTTPKFLILRVSAECIAIDLRGLWVEGDCK